MDGGEETSITDGRKVCGVEKGKEWELERREGQGKETEGANNTVARQVCGLERCEEWELERREFK